MPPGHNGHSNGNGNGHRNGAAHKNGRKRDRSARERELLAAACKLFAAHGYETTTTREIAAEAGCAEGLIHRYFQGKSGLLVAIIDGLISQEVVDLTQKLRQAPSATEEITQLVSWELDHMWKQRDFYRVLIPQAVRDASVGRMVRRAGPLQRAKAIEQRLHKYQECRVLRPTELESLSHFIGAIGFMFGFMRPAVLRQDRSNAKRMASDLTRIFVRGLSSSM